MLSFDSLQSPYVSLLYQLRDGNGCFDGVCVCVIVTVCAGGN